MATLVLSLMGTEKDILCNDELHVVFHDELKDVLSADLSTIRDEVVDACNDYWYYKCRFYDALNDALGGILK